MEAALMHNGFVKAIYHWKISERTIAECREFLL